MEAYKKNMYERSQTRSCALLYVGRETRAALGMCRAMTSLSQLGMMLVVMHKCK